MGSFTSSCLKGTDGLLMSVAGFFGRTLTEPVLLTPGPITWSIPIPSKDGKKIFSSGTIARGELVRYDVQSKTLHSWLGGISAEFVAFSSWMASPSLTYVPQGILWTANRDGTKPVQLTDPPWHPFLPRWSPDSSQILFSQDDSEDNARSYIVSSQGGAPLAASPGIQGGPGRSALVPRRAQDCFWFAGIRSRKSNRRDQDSSTFQLTR